MITAVFTAVDTYSGLKGKVKIYTAKFQRLILKQNKISILGKPLSNYSGDANLIGLPADILEILYSKIMFLPQCFFAKKKNML